MRTQCPDCLTIFSVELPMLKQAEGQVRCAKCRHVFDALEAIVEDEQPPAVVAEDSIPTLDIESADSPSQPQRYSSATSLLHPELLSDSDTPSQKSGFLKRTLFGLLFLVAAVALLLQTAYYFRGDLARWPQLTPVLESICEMAQPWCSMPQPRDLEAIQLQSRHVVSHPNREGALIISATFRNEASFTQAYPRLLVSMSNVRGQTVASRHFQPGEYIVDTEQIKNGMTPGDKGSFSIEIADPGSDAVAFEIHFY